MRQEQINLIKEIFGKKSIKEIDKIIKQKIYYLKDHTLYRKLCNVQGYIILSNEIQRTVVRYIYDDFTYEFKLLTKDNVKNVLDYKNSIDILNFAALTARKVFGEDRVDVSNSSIIIYYPSIEITDGKLTHTMRDVYITVNKNNNNGLKLQRISRGTLTSSEMRSSYLFSHTSSGQFDYISESFCYGNDYNPVYHLQQNTKIGNIKNLEMWFHSIELYLSWESKDGVPYRSIKSVKKDTSMFNENSRYSYPSAKKYDEIFKTCVNEITTFNYEYTDSIKLTSETLDNINSIITNKYSEYLSLIHNGDPVIKNTRYDYNNIKNNFEGKKVITFKNKDVKLEIINTDDESSLQKGIPQHVIKTIENKFLHFIKKELYATAIENY